MWESALDVKALMDENDHAAIGTSICFELLPSFHPLMHSLM